MKKPDGGPRSIRHTVRWSEAEWRQVRGCASRAGVKPSSYIRAAVLGKAPAAKAPRTARTRFEEPRSIDKHIRFHPEEWRRIQRSAATVRLPPIRFVREAAVGYQLGSRANAEAIRQLAKAGVNLNQIARVANASGQIMNVMALRRALGRLHAALNRLL